jgi:hypothetical protein
MTWHGMAWHDIEHGVGVFEYVGMDDDAQKIGGGEACKRIHPRLPASPKYRHPRMNE